MSKQVIILGSTGSIGRHSLQLLAQHKKHFQVKTLTARQNVQLLAQQSIEFGVQNVVLADESKLPGLKELLAGHNINIYGISDNFLQSEQHYDVAIVGIDGISALKPIYEIMARTKIIALANKESIICAGEFLLAAAKKHGTQIIPLDSEHNAIWQVFEERNRQHIKQVVLTASGGPFLARDEDTLKNVQPSEAVKHPNWQMGQKISVDSANMVNKGLELMEACLLFNLPMSHVDAVIHPQSLMHGLVYYADGSMLAHLADHNMQIPISTALNYPERTACQHQHIDLAKIGSLQFQEVNKERFPLFFLAKQAYNAGVAARIIFNVANEVAVAAFLRSEIGFLDINNIIIKALESSNHQEINSIEEVYVFADEVQQKAMQLIT
jgi:1-deoxy-D-xylulose-5-phosphate reductoisomerase